MAGLKHFHGSKLARLIPGPPDLLSSWALCFVANKGKARNALYELIQDPRSNVSTVRPATKVMASTLLVHNCSDCGRGFRSKQQRAVHEFRAHGIRPALHYRVSGRSCNACMLNFAHRAALWGHISHKSQACKTWYTEHGIDLPVDLVDAEVESERLITKSNIHKGKARYAVGCPVGRLPGPCRLGTMARKMRQQNRYYT